MDVCVDYRLVLQAVDRGSPPLTGTSTVRVQVVDVNDNSPAIPPTEPVVIAESECVLYSVSSIGRNVGLTMEALCPFLLYLNVVALLRCQMFILIMSIKS